ncbi:MAG: stage III sporulation protein AE [Prevotella sp.]|nr:stage III sporulation protein AE [Prevotella sp.]
MKTVKKISALLAAALSVLFGLPFPAVQAAQAVQTVQPVQTVQTGQAADTVRADEYSDIAGELGIDVGSLNEGLTPEAKKILEEKNLTADNPSAMSEITPKDVFLYIWEEFKKSLTKPLRLLVSLMAVILVAALIEGMEDSIPNKSLSKIFGVICVLISVGIISDSVSESISRAAEALDSGGTFMMGYVPVFAGITASSGGVTSAAAYNVLVLLAAQTAVQLSGEMIVPALSVCMAMGIVEAVNPGFRLSGITEALKKAVTFVMGFIMTVFIGLLSLQSIVGASADTLGVKAAKYVVSNFIPVIGGAVADTYATVKNSLGLLRGGVGFIGIAAIFIMVLPPVLDITAMRLVFGAADVAAELFGLSGIKVLIKNTGWILSAVFSILVCFAVMLIIATAILMLVGLNIS